MTKLIGLTGAYDFLERMILEPAGARYNPDWKKARENLENSHDENLDYLGTYFPRTVLESAVIFEHLMRTMPSVKKMLAERDVIRVLDFGCGTGGELLGFLIALGWEFNWELPAVEVDAIDGNQDALGMMQDIMHLCRDKWDFDLRVRTVTHKAEKSGFAPANVKLRDDYDVLVNSLENTTAEVKFSAEKDAFTDGGCVENGNAGTYYKTESEYVRQYEDIPER